MRCNSSYQLSRNCPSVDKTASFKFDIGSEVVYCCPICADLLAERLRNAGEQFFLSPCGEEK